MILMAARSKTEQVLGYLRGEMESGRMKPGDRLLSMRALAAHFSTSEQVVRSAYDILEDEGVLVKIPRRGVFVAKHRATSHLKEVFILGLGVREGSVYFGEILKLTHPPCLRPGFSFTTKTFPPDISNSEVLKVEIERIDKMVEIDCVLVHGASLSAEDVEACSKLKKPLLFVGDFSRGEFNELEFNQVTGDNAFLAEQEVRYHYERGENALTLFTGSLEHLFNRQFHSGVEKAARLAGMKARLVEFPKGASFLSEEKRREAYSKILEESVADGEIGGGALVSGVNKGLIRNILARSAPEIARKLSFPPDCDIDYALFRDAISARIDELIDGDEEKRKIRVKLPLKFAE